MSPKTVQDLLESQAFKDKIIVISSNSIETTLRNYMKVLIPCCTLILAMCGWAFTQVVEKLDRVTETSATLSKNVAVHAQASKDLKERFIEMRTSSIPSFSLPSQQP